MKVLSIAVLIFLGIADPSNAQGKPSLPREIPCDQIDTLPVENQPDWSNFKSVDGSTDAFPNPPCGIDPRLEPGFVYTGPDQQDIPDSVKRECVYFPRDNEYECICETNSCKDFLEFGTVEGFIQGGSEGFCNIVGYKLQQLRTWWWLCVPGE